MTDLAAVQPGDPDARPGTHLRIDQGEAVTDQAESTREVPFCEPCAMGFSCPGHDPRPADGETNPDIDITFPGLEDAK